MLFSSTLLPAVHRHNKQNISIFSNDPSSLRLKRILAILQCSIVIVCKIPLKPFIECQQNKPINKFSQSTNEKRVFFASFAKKAFYLRSIYAKILKMKTKKKSQRKNVLFENVRVPSNTNSYSHSKSLNAFVARQFRNNATLLFLQIRRYTHNQRREKSFDIQCQHHVLDKSNQIYTTQQTRMPHIQNSLTVNRSNTSQCLITSQRTLDNS